jgi:hypothetical protein
MEGCRWRGYDQCLGESGFEAQVCNITALCICVSHFFSQGFQLGYLQMKIVILILCCCWGGGWNNIYKMLRVLSGMGEILCECCYILTTSFMFRLSGANCICIGET